MSRLVYVFSLMLLLGACGRSDIAGRFSPMPAPTQVNMLDEVAGDNCDHGGVRIVEWADDNRNDTLDEDEITSSMYVCNGAPGSAGEDGQDGENGDDGQDGVAQGGTLVTVDDVPPDVDCQSGGIRINVGVDTNQDGVLAIAEVDTSRVVCHGSSGGGDIEPNHLEFQIACFGSLEGENLDFEYVATIFGSGAVFVSGGIITGEVGVYNSAIFSAAQAGSEDAAVFVVGDVFAPQNSWGRWRLSLNRESLRVTIRYDDVDSDGVRGHREWRMAPENCSVNRFETPSRS